MYNNMMDSMKKPVGTPKDSIDIAKEKSIKYAKQDFSRKDFAQKKSPLSDSALKYRKIAFDAARNMSKEDLAKKGISKKITKQGDTAYSYKSGTISAYSTYPKNK